MENITRSFSPNKALINLFGIGGIGKTATLTALYSLILQSSSFRLIKYCQISQTDLHVICEYEGKVVGIITMGDPGCEGEVETFLNLCTTHSCDRIFTASRTYGNIYNMVKAFANVNGYTFIETSPLYMRFPNAYNGNFDFLHKIFAYILLKLI